MKVLVVGSEITIKMITRCLSNEGIKLVSSLEVLEDNSRLTREGFDIAVVDGLLKQAETACRSIRELYNIPVVLLVDRRSVDWKRLQSLAIDGYIPQETKGKELAARLRSVARRHTINGAGRAGSSGVFNNKGGKPITERGESEEYH